MEDPNFKELLPTLRAYYAYLKCGRQILMEVFLWKQKLPEIQNVETYLLKDFGMINKDYRKDFNATTRENFKSSGLTKIDITGLWRMHHKVNDFFKDTGSASSKASWTKLEILLDQIKQERNDIMHTLLQKQKIKDDNELNAFLDSVSDHVDDVIQAFHDQYRDYATEQQRMDLKIFVTSILDEVRKEINEDKVKIDIQHTGKGNINVSDNIAKDILKQISNVAGEDIGISIQHHGVGDINISTHTINVSQNNATIII